MKHERICIKSNLSDLELRAMYQEASALLLPLTNVTACNSILEAMACGLPIITTDVGSNASYLSGTENILVPINDTSYLIDATINLLKNEDKLTTIGKSSRTRVIDFEWSNIAKDVVNFYTLLASKSQTN